MTCGTACPTTYLDEVISRGGVVPDDFFAGYEGESRHVAGDGRLLAYARRGGGECFRGRLWRLGTEWSVPVLSQTLAEDREE
jgi:hypothetical protein